MCNFFLFFLFKAFYTEFRYIIQVIEQVEVRLLTIEIQPRTFLMGVQYHNNDTMLPPTADFACV